MKPNEFSNDENLEAKNSKIKKSRKKYENGHTYEELEEMFKTINETYLLKDRIFSFYYKGAYDYEPKQRRVFVYKTWKSGKDFYFEGIDDTTKNQVKLYSSDQEDDGTRIFKLDRITSIFSPKVENFFNSIIKFFKK